MISFARALFLTLIFILSTQASSAQNICEQIFIRNREVIKAGYQKLPERGTITAQLADFARENNLPSKWVELGPPERRVKRLFVALDTTKPELVQKYLNRFNLDTKLDEKVDGTLVIEFAAEDPNREHYVTAVLRPSADPDAQIYRWGKPELQRSNWWAKFLKGRARPTFAADGIEGFAHLIELNQQEKENVKFYLQHSDVYKKDPIVGPCKSDNCVAWISNIELGVTKEGATTEERRHLLPELGVARAMAHFEIGRRLIHAASERHTAILTFVEGEKGIETFLNDFESHLPPEPKIPYANIIKGLKFNSPAEKAVSIIQDGAKVFLPIAAGASPDAVNALVERAALGKKGYDVHVLVNGISANAFKKGIETTDGKFRVKALFLGGNLRELYADGKVDVVPGNLSDFTRMMHDPTNQDFQYDAIVVRVSKPRDGVYSLGPNNDMIKTIIRNRPGIKVIAEVNENVPWTKGDNKLREDEITAKFESNTELAGPPAIPANEIDTRIAHNIASLFEFKYGNPPTLQIGIGNIFGGVPEALKARGLRQLKISTEMFGDAMKQMIEDGVAESAETGFAYGSSDLYKWLNDNEKVEFKETEYVNSPGRVAQIANFYAVNTALQVNLSGEVNATMGPNGRMSSVGGQVEFMSGASRSKGGKAIIAIRSTAKNDSLSTIVLDLYRGPITTPAENVTHVVTEYGVAKITAKSESERAIALISIAHPKFRQQLIDEALARKMIRADQVKLIPLQ